MATCLFCTDCCCCNGNSSGDNSGSNSLSGSNYVLPIATETRLGGVIIGDGLSVNSSGKINVTLVGDGSATAANITDSEFLNYVFSGGVVITMPGNESNVTLIGGNDNVESVAIADEEFINYIFGNNITISGDGNDNVSSEGNDSMEAVTITDEEFISHIFGGG